MWGRTVRVLVLVWLMLGMPLSVLAQGYERLGYGRIVNNDLVGDGEDRWQTGSVTTSRVWGPGWYGALPTRPFELLELRIGGQIIAPEDLRAPSATDRPFAGALSLGLHTHFQRRGLEMSVGGDLVVTGPQTGLDSFQTALHDLLGEDPASRSVLSRQVDNGLYPTLVTEAGFGLKFGTETQLRPFVEARWGVETLARVGFDLSIGTVGKDELLVRDPVTGQRFRAIEASAPGRAYVFGVDVAQVSDSAFLPASQGFDLTEPRVRVRTGLHWQGFHNSLFVGATYLGKEFKAQPSGQVVGSARLKFEF